MTDNSLILPEQSLCARHETEVGVGKAGLKIRLAADMDETFLERLNKFCYSRFSPPLKKPKSDAELKFY